MNFNHLKEFMDGLTDWIIPGNAVSVCINNEEVFNYQSGYSDIEEGIKMTDDKFFNIYSCSKVATVVAGLQMLESGKVTLDTPLYDIIPEYRTMHIKDENGNIKRANNPILLRHLFTMTAGFSYNTETPAFEKARELTNGKMNTVDVIKCLSEDFLGFEPGEKWQYSLGHDVLAAVVEVVSGVKFREYMKENIFLPLGIKDVYYHNHELHDKMASQYNYEVDEQDIVKLQSAEGKTDGGKLVKVEKTVAHIFGDEYDSGGTGITTTVSGYSSFISALANKGVGKTGERILSEKSLELLATNQLNEEHMKNFAWPQLKGYGYGLGVRTMMDTKVGNSTGNVGEFGWGGAAGATVLVDPKLNLSMFYTHHMLNPQEEYYQPRLRNALYNCIK